MSAELIEQLKGMERFFYDRMDASRGDVAKAAREAIEALEPKPDSNQAARFWGLMVYPDEAMTPERIKAELTDYHFMMEQVPKVYMHVTGGVLSKPNYFADGVISAADDFMTKMVEESVEAARGEASAHLTPAATDVLAERARQITKDFTHKHDDEHDAGELSAAASAYALAAADVLHPASQGDGDFSAENAPPSWPIEWGDFKPGTPRRMLEKAAAMILAEMERIDRAAQPCDHSKVCGNCDTALPAGCSGVFRDEGMNCLLNHADSEGGEL